jgi:hypothetical protein
MGKPVEFVSPVGRLVQGDCFEPQTKDLSTGMPLTIKTGPNAGQPTQKYFIAVAFAKSDAKFAELKAMFTQVARAAFPQFFPNGSDCINPNFSWKIIDGDGYDQNGKPNNSKEGFAGCWIMRCASSYPFKCFAAGKYLPTDQLQMVGNVNPIPRGHYIRVAGNVSDNIPSASPGLYVNANMIEWAAIGDVIVSGPDAAAVFGGAPASLPAGYAPPAAPMAPPAPAMAAPPSVPVQPLPGILNGPQMLPAAGTTTYAQYIASGWNNAQLIQHGFMAAPAAAVPAPLPPVGSAPIAPPPAPAAPAPTAKTMLPAAGATTYEQYAANGWTDAQLVQNGFMAAA